MRARADAVRSVQAAAEALLHACVCRTDDLRRDLNLAFPPATDMPADQLRLLERIDFRTDGGSR